MVFHDFSIEASDNFKMKKARNPYMNPSWRWIGLPIQQSDLKIPKVVAPDVTRVAWQLEKLQWNESK